MELPNYFFCERNHNICSPHTLYSSETSHLKLLNIKLTFTSHCRECLGCRALGPLELSRPCPGLQIRRSPPLQVGSHLHGPTHACSARRQSLHYLAHACQQVTGFTLILQWNAPHAYILLFFSNMVITTVTRIKFLKQRPKSKYNWIDFSMQVHP